MANKDTTAKYVGRGINDCNIVYCAVVVPTGGLSKDDTLTVTLPEGVEPGLLPATTHAAVYAAPVAGVSATTNSFEVVSHDTVNGVTVLKAVDALAAGCKAVLVYVGA